MILLLSSRASCAALTATATMCVQVQNEEKEAMVTQQIYDKIRYTLGIYVFTLLLTSSEENHCNNIAVLS